MRFVITLQKGDTADFNYYDVFLNPTQTIPF